MHQHLFHMRCTAHVATLTDIYLAVAQSNSQGTGSKLQGLDVLCLAICRHVPYLSLEGSDLSGSSSLYSRPRNLSSLFPYTGYVLDGAD